MRVLPCFLLLLAASASSAQEQFDARLKIVEQRIAALRDHARKAAEPRLALDREIRALAQDDVRGRADLEARRDALAREDAARRLRATRGADRARIDTLLKQVRGGDVEARQKLTRLLLRIDDTLKRAVRAEPVREAPTASRPEPVMTSPAVTNPAGGAQAAELERRVVELTRKVLILETRLRELRRAISEAEAGPR